MTEQIKLFAFDQAMPKLGCKYTEYSQVGPPSYGWSAGSNEKCSASYYVSQPYVFVPSIFIILAVFALFIKRKH